jgi:UDP-N-acetylglucosamine--N-acetylmuramyl-(pentapeptide) pyrophosphoryl-undecaprenol N-acetylglucosamine transferase
VAVAVTAALVVVSAAVLTLGLVATRPSAWLVFAGVLGVLVSVGILVAVGVSWVTVQTEARLRRRIEGLEATVQDTRAKASRHEWAQEQALERIEWTSREAATGAWHMAWAALREVPPVGAAQAPGAAPRVLFVTSNGGGMGHIARCAAVLRHAGRTLDGRILTLSTAASTVAAAGYDVTYFPSHTTAGVSPDRWRRQFTRRLLDELAAYRPESIVFDGAWVYPSLTDAADLVGLPLVWLRRGLWREGTDLTQVKSWRDYVTSVIVPGDIAETRETAPEVFRDATWVDPVSLAPASLMPRETALASLGLDPERRYALVQLSGGNGDGSATAAAVRAVRGAGDIVPVVVRSPLLSSAVTHDAATIDARFPLVDMAGAWEFTVTGAGYNSVHENLHTRTPGVYLPSALTLRDDQERRARVVAGAGLGVTADDVDGIAGAVADLIGGRRADEMRTALRESPSAQGALSAAEAIVVPRPEMSGSASNFFNADSDKLHDDRNITRDDR